MPGNRRLTLMLLWAVLAPGALGCRRLTPSPTPQTAILPTPSAIAASRLHSTVTLIPEERSLVNVCEYVRILRSTCYKDGSSSDWFNSVTALSLAQCSALSLVLTAEPLKESLKCLANLKSTSELRSGDPFYCTENPVEECVLRVLEARSSAIQDFDTECRDLGRVCGSQPRKFRSDVCGILDAAITPSYRKQMRACLSWNCYNRDCVSELLFYGRQAQSYSNVIPPSLDNSPCTPESGFPRVVTVEALENYGQCPPT
jgi:hypothetical protein